MKPEIYLNYDDVSILPAVKSDIKSRKECNPYDEDGMLPIFASCMDTVLNKENYEFFLKNRINVVVPRNISIEERIDIMKKRAVISGTSAVYPFAEPFVAFSEEETKNVFIDATDKDFLNDFREILNISTVRICIDVAQGHMSSIINLVGEVKKKYGNHVVVMAGNIAHYKAYKEYNDAGCDYVRAGIGGGSCCLSSSNVGVHAGYFTLIQKLWEEKEACNGTCKIIADGGIKGYRDIQKALLYADYVMIGGLFNKALESAGKTTYGKSYWNIRGYKIMRPLKTLFTYGKVVPKDKYEKVAKLIKEGKITVWKQMYGMSSKEAQRSIAEGNGRKFIKGKTSEGLIKYQKVEYTLPGWVENETDYLRSAMSYCGVRTLSDYKNGEWIREVYIPYNK